MKYRIKINDILINQDNSSEIVINLSQKSIDSYANEKNRVEVVVDGFVYTNDNMGIKNKDLIKKLVEIQYEYLDISLEIENMVYKLPKMYIHSLNQSFSNGIGKYKLVLLQKFIGKEKELVIYENSN
ncbi:hypothetical protein [Oceanivirga salmonicida]|uniref:hypothetical protein n=1 Tax=Oceanivirga salmonicida TaxID=1769291 RepID=UPI000829A7E5|nr:hypothetical protein [Oceanivirga salmonicida]